MQIVKDIHSHIFRGYDIRGVVDVDLNADVVYTIGRAYANYLSERRIKETAVGHDCRLSSDEYTKAIIAGLNDGGVNTYELGQTLTQIVNYSCYFFRTKGSVIISFGYTNLRKNILIHSYGDLGRRFQISIISLFSEAQGCIITV